MRLAVSDMGRGAVAQLDAWGAESLTWLELGGPRPARCRRPQRPDSRRSAPAAARTERRWATGGRQWRLEDLGIRRPTGLAVIEGP